VLADHLCLRRRAPQPGLEVVALRREARPLWSHRCAREVDLV